MTQLLSVCCSKLRPYKGVWIPIEYMPWMGDILAADRGTLYCPNAQCHCEVGCWDWADTLFKTELAASAMELPLVGINKAKVMVAPSPSSSRRLSNGGSSENTPRDSLTPRDGSLTSSTPRSSASHTPSSSGSNSQTGGGGCTPVSGGTGRGGFLSSGGSMGPAVEGIS